MSNLNISDLVSNYLKPGICEVVPFARAIPLFRKEEDTYDLSDVIVDASRAISLFSMGYYIFNPYSDAKEIIQRNFSVYLVSTIYSSLVHYNCAKEEITGRIEFFVSYFSGIAKQIHKSRSVPLLMAGLVSPNLINYVFQHRITLPTDFKFFGNSNSSFNYTTPIHFYTAIMAAKSLDKTVEATLNRETKFLEKSIIFLLCMAGAYLWEIREVDMNTSNDDTTSDILAGTIGFLIGLKSKKIK
jgi:hypothetical protein